MPYAPRARAATLLALTGLALAACAAPRPGDAVVERTDERSGITVTTLAKPLLFARARPGAQLEPASDIALGPVEVNRMGARMYYLWTSLAGHDGAPLRIRLVASETVVEPVPAPDAELPLARPAYARLGGGAGENWYVVSRSDLARLLGRADLAVEIASADGGWLRYEPWAPVTKRLDAFIVRQGLVGRPSG